MESPHLSVGLACVDNNSSGEETPPLPCTDLVLASENARVRNAYPITLGDDVEDDIARMLFVPKSSGGGVTLERQDYREIKRRRLAAAGALPPSE